MVTEKQLANLVQIKPGEIKNPDGARTHNPEMRKLKNLTEEEMLEVGTLVIKGSIEELIEIKKDPKASALKAMIASVAIKTISKGDPYALEILLNRLIGKVKEKIEHSGKVDSTVVTVNEQQVKEILDKVRNEF